MYKLSQILLGFALGIGMFGVYLVVGMGGGALLSSAMGVVYPPILSGIIDLVILVGVAGFLYWRKMWLCLIFFMITAVMLFLPFTDPITSCPFGGCPMPAQL